MAQGKMKGNETAGSREDAKAQRTATDAPAGTPAVRTETAPIGRLAVPGEKALSGEGAIVLELPVAETAVGPRPFHIQAHLQDRHATAWRRYQEGVFAAGVRDQNGSPIRTHAECLRYLLDQMADAMGIPEAV